MISLVMPTYNRAGIIGRAIRSVLAQTHADWELCVIDGASTDDTEGSVRAFGDPRVRYVRQDANRGITSGRNRGLDEARGDWVGMFDSDDELVPQALGTLICTLADVDPRLDAIGCNCFDSQTGRLTGRGLDHDQYLTVPKVVRRARGEHWGIFHKRILGSRRFDERISGYESVLWYRIHDGARWYYKNRGLRIFHTEGRDRSSHDRKNDYKKLCAIVDFDPEYIALLRGWSPRAYRRFQWKAAGAFILEGDEARYARVVADLRSHGARVLSAALRLAHASGPVARAVMR